MLIDQSKKKKYSYILDDIIKRSLERWPRYNHHKSFPCIKNKKRDNQKGASALMHRLIGKLERDRPPLKDESLLYIYTYIHNWKKFHRTSRSTRHAFEAKIYTRNSYLRKGAPLKGYRCINCLWNVISATLCTVRIIHRNEKDEEEERKREREKIARFKPIYSRKSETIGRVPLFDPWTTCTWNVSESVFRFKSHFLPRLTGWNRKWMDRLHGSPRHGRRDKPRRGLQRGISRENGVNLNWLKFENVARSFFFLFLA